MPENVRVVLEAINFVVTSGECYVIMGLARRPVEASVGLSFEKVASEMIFSSAPNEGTVEEQAKRQRWLFSRQYLDKLINIEIPAKPASSSRMEDLIVGGVALQDASSWIDRLARLAQKAALPVIISLLLIVFGCTAGVLIGRAKSPLESQTSGVAPQVVGGSTVTVAGTGVDRPSPSQITFALQPASPLRVGETAYGPAILALIVLICIGWRVLGKADEVLVEDSPAFRKALEIWDTFIVQTHATPRSTKRFMNRVRCLAMRIRPFSESKSRWRMSSSFPKCPQRPHRSLRRCQNPRSLLFRPSTTSHPKSFSSMTDLSDLCTSTFWDTRQLAQSERLQSTIASRDLCCCTREA